MNRKDLILKGDGWTVKNGKSIEKNLGLDKALDVIRSAITDTLDYCEQVESENDALKSECWKDEKLQEMKNELDQMKEDHYRGFSVTKEETKMIIDWQNNHANLHHKRKSLGWRYQFTPTILGLVGCVRCETCMQKVLDELGSSKNYGYIYNYWDKRKELVKKYDAEFVFRELN